MPNINVRVVGSANMAAMTGPFAKLEAQITAINAQLTRMVTLQNGVDPRGYERMTRAAAQNSRTFRSAAASTGMFEVQQLRVNKATDEFISKLQKQKISFSEMYRNQKLVNAAYQDQLRLQNAVARTSTMGTTHGKMTVDMVTPNLVAQGKALDYTSQKLAYYNALLKSGSTQLINWGKNTQWAGRQLSMGLTMPVVALGAAAGVMAYQVDQALTRVAKVYNTTAQSGMRQQQELDRLRQQGLQTALEAARQYGSAATDTLNVQAQLAAAGKTGNELQKDTISVMKISRLGELDYNDAVKATISLQSVFGMRNQELADSFNYINKVENQTSLETSDFAKAIPIAAAPVKAFGGNLQELGTLLVAMKQNGIEATQGANAIKAAMQRLGRPSEQVQKEWKALTGTDITKIFDQSANLIDLFTRIGDATQNLAPKDQIRAFAGLFGTYQVTRMMAMVHGMEDLKNGVGQVSTAAKVASEDTSAWAKTAQQEIDRYRNSISGKWDTAINEMKLQLSTLGEPFVVSATIILKTLSKVIAGFNELPDAGKRLIAIPIAIGALAGPVLMLTGLMANLIGQGASVVSKFLPSMELYTTSQKAAALAADANTKAITTEMDAMSLMTLQLQKLTAAQAAANREAREARFNQLVAGGMSRTAAYGQLASERRRDLQNTGLMNAKGESIAIANASGVAADNTAKMSKAAKLLGPSLALGAAGMAAMALSSNETVQHIGEILMISSLIGPAIIPVGSKLVSSFAAATTAAKGVSGAMAGARAGAAAFAAEMGVASLATAGILAAVVAIGAAWYFTKKHMDAIEARQKAILDKQINANKALVSTSANFAQNLGKAAGAYDSIIHGNRPGGISTITGTPSSSMTYKAYKYYTEDETGKAEAKSLKTSLSDTDVMMAKLRQQFLDLIKIGGLTSKQAMETIQGQMLALGKSGQEALAIAKQVQGEFGNIKNMDWGKAIANSLKVAQDELDRTSKAAGMGSNVSYTPYYSVDWKAEVEDYKKGLMGIKPQLKELAGIFNTAINEANSPEEAKKAIKQVMDAALQQFEASYQQLISSPRMKAMLEGKGIFNAQDLAQQFGAGNISYADLRGAAGKPGSANYLDPQRMQAMLQMARAFETTLIGTVSSSNDLDDNVKSVAGFIRAMTQNAKQMTFKEAKANAQQIFEAVTRAQGALTIARANNVNGSNRVGVDAAKQALAAAESEAQMNLSAIAAAKNIKIGATATKTLYNIMHNVKDETKGVADGAKDAANALNMIPRRIDITLNKKEMITVAHDAMSAVQDDMVTSAQNAFDNRWDATMNAAQQMWDKRSQALQERQSSASQALQNRQQAAQEAMEKRFQKAEENINKRYQKRIDNINKVIKAEQDADAQRQKMYEAEKKRMEDLANMANKNIDFNTALNQGNFDEAAKIRNDMDAQAAENTLDARMARESAKVQKTVDRLQKKIEQLEKQRDKELKQLQALEERQKKHLERMQQAQSNALQKAQQAEQDALKKREDADMASMQKTRDYEEAMLNQRLDLFKTYVAKNQKDLERWMHRVGLTYDDFGSDIKAKGESWASYFQKALHQHIIAGASQIISDKMWDSITPKLAGKLLKGLGFKSLAAFQKFVNTGRMKNQERGGGDRQQGGRVLTPHGGGMVGRDQMYNRKGLRGAHGGLHGSETWARVQKGEFVVNRRSAMRHRRILEQINDARGGYSKDAYGGPSGVLPIVGYPTAMMAQGMVAGTGRATQAAMKAARKYYRKAAKTGTDAGFTQGMGGRHRPIGGGYGITNYHGVEDGYNAGDIAAPIGTPVFAVANGRITSSYDIRGNEPRRRVFGQNIQDGFRSYGRVIKMAFDGGGGAVFAHLSQRFARTGQRVKGGAKIGLSGNTGNVQSSIGNGAHLHFGTTPMTPYAFMKKGGTVRFDNTPAILHKNETVLTSQLTKQFKENLASGRGNVYDIDVAVHGSDIDPNDIAEAVINKIERAERRGPHSRRNKPN